MGRRHQPQPGGAPGATGAVLDQFGQGLAAPTGIALDDEGNIYVSNSGKNKVEKYSPSGALLATVAGPGKADNQVRQPWNLQIVNDRIYIADGLSNRVLVLTLTGSYLTKFDGSGTPAGKLVSPRGVAVAPDGTVAAVSFGSNRVTFWN